MRIDLINTSLFDKIPSPQADSLSNYTNNTSDIRSTHVAKTTIPEDRQRTPTEKIDIPESVISNNDVKDNNQTK